MVQQFLVIRLKVKGPSYGVSNAPIQAQNGTYGDMYLAYGSPPNYGSGKLGLHATYALAIGTTQTEVDIGTSAGTAIEITNRNTDLKGDVTIAGNASGSSTSTGSFGAGFINNKLGIGTSSPEANLHLGTSRTFKLGTGNTNTTSLMDIVANSGTYAFQVWDDNSLSTPRFVVERTGKVGVGMDPAYGLLQVAGQIVVQNLASYQNRNFVIDINSGQASNLTMMNSDKKSFELAISGSIYTSGSIEVLEDILPTADNNSNLGSPSKRFANIHSADLQLSNEDTKGNDVDGTTGNWTLQEGEEDIFLINNKTGKKYSIMLKEVKQ